MSPSGSDEAGSVDISTEGSDVDGSIAFSSVTTVSSVPTSSMGSSATTGSSANISSTAGSGSFMISGSVDISAEGSDVGCSVKFSSITTSSVPTSSMSSSIATGYSTDISSTTGSGSFMVSGSVSIVSIFSLRAFS